MIQSYLESQIKKAAYETIDNGTLFYAEIKDLQGVWATGKTIEECRDNLLSTLEGWVVLSLKKNLRIPGFHMPRTRMKVAHRAYA